MVQACEGPYMTCVTVERQAFQGEVTQTDGVGRRCLCDPRRRDLGSDERKPGENGRSLGVGEASEAQDVTWSRSYC